jgi:MoaA/NifB/PqqE/SkfB family radical SAM enzyme
MRDYSEAPMLVIWELTQACDLACLHCRASAQPDRNHGELSTEEGYRLLEQIREFGNPLVVLTGGDPLKRPDLFNIIERSVGFGLRTTVTPSATPLLTHAAVSRFKSCGVSRMAVSLDGPDKAIHDGFRGVDGSYARTLAALKSAARIGLETQINTTVARHNMEHLDSIARIVAESGARLWSVFFLVVTGRAQLSDDLTAEEYEAVFEFLYRTSLTAGFDVKTTEAPHYRRFHAQQRKQAGGGAKPVNGSAVQRHAGINDGKGLVFVSHTGEIFPSEFLEVSAGNVRTCRLADAYRNSQLFRGLT